MRVDFASHVILELLRFFVWVACTVVGLYGAEFAAMMAIMGIFFRSGRPFSYRTYTLQSISFFWASRSIMVDGEVTFDSARIWTGTFASLASSVHNTKTPWSLGRLGH